MQTQLQKTMKTAKGTFLPLLNLKGKDYLQVMHRLVWFREEHPDWTIKTVIVERQADHAVVRAEIYNEKSGLMATGHKEEHKAHFADYMEKAETGAVGRALAMCGYGAQFAPDLDEEDRLVDSPAPVGRSTQGAPGKPISHPQSAGLATLAAPAASGTKSGPTAPRTASPSKKTADADLGYTGPIVRPGAAFDR